MEHWKSFVSCNLLAVFLLFGTDPARSDPALKTQVSLQLNASAQLLAGIQPSDPTLRLGTAQQAAWNSHSAEMRQAWAKVRDGQMAPMIAWREANLPRTCPVGKTLLYPFSGPDFFNAYWLFPECESYIMFGLEHVGEMPALETMGEREFARLLADVRGAMTNLFVRNYFVTDTMSRQLRTAQLRGVLPVIAVAMALSGVEVLSATPLTLAAAGGTTAAAGAEPQQKRHAKRKLVGITVEFRRSDSTRVQRLHYFSVDATDASLATQPEFLEHLRSLGQAPMLLKSASYLLHGTEFRRLRNVLLEVGTFLVQDDTGLPYPLLLKRGWQVEIYGRYERPIPPFEYAFQPALAKAFQTQKPESLPFLFGYRRNVDVDRSHLMIARRSPPQAAKPGAQMVQDAPANLPQQRGR
jgi:hypothetical protein